MEIQNRISGGDVKFKVQAGGSPITKILFRDTDSTGNRHDVCIGSAMLTSGKPTDLNAFFPGYGDVELYHKPISGNSIKTFETTSTGVSVTGDITVTGGDITGVLGSAVTGTTQSALSLIHISEPTRPY